MEDEDFWGHKVKGNTKEGKQETSDTKEDENIVDGDGRVEQLGEDAEEQGRSAHSEKSEEQSEEESDEELGERTHHDEEDEEEYSSEQFETSEGSDAEQEDEAERVVEHKQKPQIEKKNVESERDVSRTKLPSQRRPQLTPRKKSTKPSPYAQKKSVSPPANNSTRPARTKTYVAVSNGPTKRWQPTVTKPFSFSTPGADPTKRLRTSALRNEIEYLKKQLMEARSENRTLKQIQRRQEAALGRLDTRRSSVPTVMERQAEEIRVAKEQLRMQKEKQRELERILRERDDRLMHALDKIRRMEKNRKERGGEKREHDEHSYELDTLRNQLEEKQTKIRDMERHMILLEKNHKHQLNGEMARHKETRTKLALLEKEQKKGQANYRVARRARVQNEEQQEAAREDKVKARSSKEDVMDQARDESRLILHISAMKSLKLESGTIKQNDAHTFTRDKMEEHGSKVNYVEENATEVKSSGEKFGENEGRRDILDDLISTKPAMTTDTSRVERKEDEPVEEPWKPVEKRNSILSDQMDHTGPRDGPERSATPPQASPPPTSLKAPTADTGDKQESKSSSILDEILAPTSITKPTDHQQPAPPSKTNAEFLDSLFGPKAEEPQRERVESPVGMDSGFINSVDSTPKQVQSANKDKPKSTLIDDVFPTGKENPKMTTSNGLFPWEMDALKKTTSK